MSTESILLLVALVLPILIGFFSRVAGRAIAVAVIAGILGWGAYTYSEGRSLSFFGKAIEPTWFYAFVGALLVWEVVALYLALRARAAQRSHDA
jgi:hypothetical protein